MPAMSIFNRSSVSVQEASDRARAGAVIVDVREKDEVATGMPKGALHMPMGRVDRRVDQLRDKEVLVICQSGNRSGRVTSYLRGQGIDAHNVRGGMIAWRRAGLPTARG